MSTSHSRSDELPGLRPTGEPLRPNSGLAENVSVRAGDTQLKEHGNFPIFGLYGEPT